MTTVLVVLAVLVVLVVAVAALPLLDRACLGIAERRSSEYLAVPFGSPATVRLHGTPFLTQALRGCYRNVHVAGGGLRLGDMTGATLAADLRNVRVSLRDLAGSRPAEIACDHVEGRVLLPYGELARVANIPGLELRMERSRLVAVAAIPVPGISQLTRVNGRAVITLGAGNSVWLRVRGVSVAGISLPAVVLSQLLPTLEVPIPVPALPYGLQLTELRPTEDGLVVLGSADAVVFRRLPSASVPTGS